MEIIVRIIYLPNADPRLFEQWLKRLKEAEGVPDNIRIFKENASSWGFEIPVEQYGDVARIVDAITKSGVLKEAMRFDWEIRTFIKSK